MSPLWMFLRVRLEIGGRLRVVFGDNPGVEGWDAGVGYLAVSWRVVIPLVLGLGFWFWMGVKGWMSVGGAGLWFYFRH